MNDEQLRDYISKTYQKYKEICGEPLWFFNSENNSGLPVQLDHPEIAASILTFAHIALSISKPFDGD